MYTSGIPRTILKTLKGLQNDHLFIPIVFGLERNRYSSVFNYIAIFPAFYSIDRCATIPLVIAQSFCKDQGNFCVTKAENILELSIYLIDSSDMPSTGIYALVKDMAVSFPRIALVYLWFERKCEIVSFLLTVNEYNRTRC